MYSILLSVHCCLHKLSPTKYQDAIPTKQRKKKQSPLYNFTGFATLLINYRGSAGTGNGSICYLPSRIGTADVLDCKLATDKAIDMFPVNDKKLLLYGGSHGGFLVAHLSGLFYDFYHAAVLRNPVIDLASMIHTTDIADW